MGACAYQEKNIKKGTLYSFEQHSIPFLKKPTLFM